jgi:hypothetical protein
MAESREEVIEQLLKLKERFEGKKPVWPPIGCKDASTHILGAYAYTHLGMILEALRRAD